MDEVHEKIKLDKMRFQYNEVNKNFQIIISKIKMIFCFFLNIHLFPHFIIPKFISNFNFNSIEIILSFLFYFKGKG